MRVINQNMNFIIVVDSIESINTHAPLARTDPLDSTCIYSTLIRTDIDPLWKFPWCNGYRRGKWTRRYKFRILDEADCISYGTNTLRKL